MSMQPVTAPRQVSRGEIAAFLGVQCNGRADALFTELAAPATARPTSIVFAVDAASLAEAKASNAGLILLAVKIAAGEDDPRILHVEEPRLAFAQIYALWFDKRGGGAVHVSSILEEGVQLGPGCTIGAGAVLEAGARLGAHCVVGPRAVVHGCCTLGDRVRIQAGVVLGSDGFGYARAPEGYVGFPQIGTLEIGDDVEIGANSTIDRGALGSTRIGRGTKIDNLVHIAHNCIVGEDVIIAAQVGMAGSTTIQAGVMLGGQVGLGERVTIGSGVILGGQAGVLPGKRIDGSGEIFWGTPARPVREYLQDLVRLRRG